MGYSLYIVECADGTYYTGIATDVERRILQHNGAKAKGARYTSARRPVSLVFEAAFATRSEALKEEVRIMSSKRSQALRHDFDWLAIRRWSRRRCRKRSRNRGLACKITRVGGRYRCWRWYLRWRLCKETSQVVGHVFGGRVAFRRALRQRLEADAFQFFRNHVVALPWRTRFEARDLFK